MHTGSMAKSMSYLTSAFLTALLLTVPVLGTEMDDTDERVEKKSGRSQRRSQDPLNASFTDGSTLKLTILDKHIDLETGYGKLVIPVTDIQRIEFATRLSAEDAKRVEKAIARLAASEFRQRETASAELLKLREKAYPSLLKVAKHKDPEIANRVKRLLSQLSESVPQELLSGREHDVVHTKHSRIAGKIGVETLNVITAQFGELAVKLADLRSLRTNIVTEENVLPDPGHLSSYDRHVGKIFLFRVTGVGPARMQPFGGDALFGTDIYTLDSSLALAAIHAGVLKAGQTGVVKVTILGPQAAFKATVRNGVASRAWGAYPGGFKVSKPG